MGTTAKFNGRLTGLAMVSAQAWQAGVTTYGGRAGLNYAFD